MKSTRMKSLLGLVVCVALSGVGCGKAVDPPVPREKLRFIFSPRDLANPVFAPAIDGAKLKGKQLTETTNYDVTIEIVGTASQPSDTGGKAQKTAIAAAAAATDGGTLKGVVVSPATDPANPTDLVNADFVKTLGVPIITYDTSITDAGLATFYSVENSKAAQLGGEILAKSVGATGTVAILSGSIGTDNVGLRVRGFKAAMKAANIAIAGCAAGVDYTTEANIGCGVVVCGGSDKMCADALNKHVRDNPTITGWFFASKWMRFLARDVVEAGVTIYKGGVDGDASPDWRIWAGKAGNYTVAFDSLTQALPFVSSTKSPIQVLLGQKYWGWGYDTIGMLFDIAVNKKTFAPFTDSGVDVICANNVKAYELAWTSNNFSVPLAKCSLIP